MPRDVVAPVAVRTVENRTEFQRAAKDCVAELFKENGGHKCAIDRFGVSLARAYTFTDHHHDNRISFERVAALTSAKATAAARYLATLAGGVFYPLPKAESADAVAKLGESALSHAEVIAKGLDALADRKVTPAESRALVKEIDEAICDLAALRACAITMSEAPAK